MHPGSRWRLGDITSATSRDCIIWLASWVVLIPIPFHPLEEFKIVLETTFDELINGDTFVDFVGFKSLLEDFEILDVVVFIRRIELG